MTTQSTSSGSSSFGKCDIPAPEPAPAPAPESAPLPCRRSAGAVPLNLPQDILKLLHRHVKWETAEDLYKAHLLYTTTFRDVAKFDIGTIGKELAILKDLYSAMKEQYDICMKLRDEEDIVAEAEDDIKYEELNLRLIEIGHILSPVKNFIRILESVIKNRNQLQERSVEYKDYSERYNAMEKKRKMNVERGRVEEGLLHLLTDLGGKTSSTEKFRTMWDRIVNDLYTLALVG